MGTKRVTIQSTRNFSESFKKARVKDYESGKFTVQELSIIFGLSRVTVYKWIRRYSIYGQGTVKIVEMKESGAKKLKDLEKEVAELQQIIGQKQLKIDYLEKILDLAKQELDIDLKKNSDTLQSSGSKRTKSK